MDGAGSAIVGGTYSGTLDLGGPEPLVGPAAGAVDGPGEPIFVAKYDGLGTYVWSQSYGTTPRARSEVGAIRPAADGDLFVTGQFAGSIDFGAGAVRTSDDSNAVGLEAAFLVRLSPQGIARWSDAFAGPSVGSDMGACLAVAADGRVALGGGFDQTIDFGNGPLHAVGRAFNQFGPVSDGFVAVFDP
jgi:hypothetical protein